MYMRICIYIYTYVVQYIYIYICVYMYIYIIRFFNLAIINPIQSPFLLLRSPLSYAFLGAPLCRYYQKFITQNIEGHTGND